MFRCKRTETCVVSCFLTLLFIPRGLTVAPWNPSEPNFKSPLKVKATYFFFSFRTKHLHPKGCCEGVQGATAKPPAKPNIGRLLLSCEGRRSPEGDRKALWNKHHHTVAVVRTLVTLFMRSSRGSKRVEDPRPLYPFGHQAFRVSCFLTLLFIPRGLNGSKTLAPWNPSASNLSDPFE